MSATTPSPDYEHLLIVEDDKGKKEIVLREPYYSIGREKGCDIRLYSQFVSRRHATLSKILHEDQSFHYRICDGDSQGKPSANGLVINGSKRPAHDLKHGDEVVFGPQVFAIYQLQRRDLNPTDPFDITLIDPAMTDEQSI